MKVSRSLITLFITLIFPLCHTAAQISLPRLISDKMVLQRHLPMEIWGWASPGEQVRLSFDGKRYQTRTEPDGKWKISLPSMEAGGPYEMVIRGKNTVKLNDIMIGDVWLGAGQSNMVLNMERLKEKYPADIAKAAYPMIRNFRIDPKSDPKGPAENLSSGVWETISPETVMEMGGLTFFFARELYERYRVPIGIINSSVGGTPIEAWLSAEAARRFPELEERILRNQDTKFIDSIIRAHELAAVEREIFDQGMQQNPKWFDPDYMAEGWRDFSVPGYWEDQGLKDLDGIVWFRKDFQIPEPMATAPANLYMGRIVDADQTFLNGKQVGQVTYQYPPRRYPLPQGLLKTGNNQIVVRVTNYGRKGGFVPDKPYLLVAGNDTLDLRGGWRYKIGAVFEPRLPSHNFSLQNEPATLYNAMINPLTSFPLKGFLWYQGESNTGNPAPYEQYLKTLISDWRSKWGLGDIPFLYVQLANFMEREFEPSESKWAELREAQRKALTLPNTAMAIAIDLGKWNDIHPLNKKDLGIRLSLAARKLAYGESQLVHSGPEYTNHTTRGDTLILEFKHIGSGLQALGEEHLQGFAVAGADKKFVWANAKIKGEEVLVSHPDIPKPPYVRYAWANNPAEANLYNREGLPALPFQTDPPGELQELWKGHKAAVVLTYDDALEVHLDHALPALDARGLQASFYLTASFPGSSDFVKELRQAAANGHELGNHTLYHPCDASGPGRTWVRPENDLSKYTSMEILRELRMTNTYLKALDGQEERTFAYPCGDTEIMDGSYKGLISDDFIASRGTEGHLNIPGDIDLQEIGCYVINGQSGKEMIGLVKEAINQNAMLVLLFHGVGGGHSLDVSLQAHTELLDFLAANKKEIWTTTLIDAVRHIKNQGSK